MFGHSVGIICGIKTCKPISRDIHIDFVCFVSLCLLLSFLFFFCFFIVTHPYACYELFKKFALASLPFARPSSCSLPVRSSSLIFFLDFLASFFVQNKMAFFWHWKKKYTLQRLSLSYHPPSFYLRS